MKTEKNKRGEGKNTDINFKELGERIRIKRIMLQMKQATLGDLVGVNGNHISNIERNTAKISLSLLYKISRIFDCTIDELINGTSFSESKQFKYFEDATEYEQHMIEDFIKSLQNNNKYWLFISKSG